jgi:dephospho-CoA kinase
MRVIGLTGGIAMGKSTASAAFRRARIPVFDADAAVHHLQSEGGAAVPLIASAFPGTVHHGIIDRAALRRAVLADPAQLRRLEAILHPMVRAATDRFLARHRRAGASQVVLDVPLLLETGGASRVDCVAVVTAPQAVQRHRLRRRRMTEDQLAAVLSRQMPDAEKRARADVLIRTGLSRHHAQRQVRRLIASVIEADCSKARGSAPGLAWHGSTSRPVGIT